MSVDVVHYQWIFPCPFLSFRLGLSSFIMVADPIINLGNEPPLIRQQPSFIPPGGEPLVGVDFLLNAIGFPILAECECIIESGLADYEDFCYLVEKDIQEMAEEFSKRTVA